MFARFAVLRPARPTEIECATPDGSLLETIPRVNCRFTLILERKTPHAIAAAYPVFDENGQKIGSNDPADSRSLS